MGLIFGAGTALMALLLLLRLLPRMFGLGLFLAKTGFTATAAALFLYYMLKGSP